MLHETSNAEDGAVWRRQVTRAGFAALAVYAEARMHPAGVDLASLAAHALCWWMIIPGDQPDRVSRHGSSPDPANHRPEPAVPPLGSAGSDDVRSALREELITPLVVGLSVAVMPGPLVWRISLVTGVTLAMMAVVALRHARPTDRPWATLPILAGSVVLLYGVAAAPTPPLPWWGAVVAWHVVSGAALASRLREIDAAAGDAVPVDATR